MLDVQLPPSVTPVLQQLLAAMRPILHTRWVGMYVHGSVAMGCFNPHYSDIDILVVMDGGLAAEDTASMGRALLEISSPRLPVELSIVTADAMQHLQHPTPFAFHYGEDHRQRFARGRADFSGEHVDADLCAHIMITRRYGLVIDGPPIASTFAEVPHAFYLASILYDVVASYEQVQHGPGSGVCPVPVYAVLNFCRVWAYVTAGLVLSKAAGGEWALQHLPATHHAVIAAALSDYGAAQRGQLVDSVALKRFANDARAHFRV